MAPRKKPSSKQPNVGAWLGGNKGYVLSGSNTDTSAKADAGGGQAEAVRGELGLGAYAAGVGAAGAIGAGVAAVRSGRKAAKLDWDPKPFVEGVRTQDRASFYWKPKTDVVNPQNPDISYSVAVRPANPKASRSAPRSTDKGYKVEVSRFSGTQINEMFDSAAEYKKIVGVKPSSSANAPTSNQLFQDLQSKKVYKDLQKAQRAAERLVRRDIKRR